MKVALAAATFLVCASGAASAGPSYLGAYDDSCDNGAYAEPVTYGYGYGGGYYRPYYGYGGYYRPRYYGYGGYYRPRYYGGYYGGYGRRYYGGYGGYGRY